jgi:hypothetical protein
MSGPAHSNDQPGGGQPTITVEQRQGAAGEAGAQARPGGLADADAGQDTAATQPRDSEDPNTTPEAQEGAAGTHAAQAAGTQQQTTATPWPVRPVNAARLSSPTWTAWTSVNERGEQLGDVETVVRSAADNKIVRGDRPGRLPWPWRRSASRFRWKG